jgi:hypothetical protein
VVSTWNACVANGRLLAALARMSICRSYICLVLAVKKTGAVPPGNAKGNKEWSSRQRVAKPEVRLTPGKGVQDLTVPLADILQQVVDQNRVSRTTMQGQQSLLLLNSGCSSCILTVTSRLGTTS